MQPPYRYLLVAALTAGLALLLLYLLLPYTLPFLFAALLAAIIDRPVDYLERRTRWPRGIVVALVLMGAVLSLAGFLALLVANLASELEVFYRALPGYAEQWRTFVERFVDGMQSLSAVLPGPVYTLLTGSVEDLTSVLAGGASELLAKVKHLPNIFASLFIAAFTTFFLSRDKRGLATAYMRLLPPTWHQWLFRLKRQIAAGSLGLVRGQLILICCTFVLSTAAFSAFGISYAWLLGLLTALLDVMPMVGPSGVFLPVVLQLALAGHVGRAAGLAAVWAALLLLRQILEVKVMGSQLGVHPLTMIFALYTGVRLFGLNGLWLGPFIVITMKAAYTVLCEVGEG